MLLDASYVCYLYPPHYGVVSTFLDTGNHIFQIYQKFLVISIFTDSLFLLFKLLLTVTYILFTVFCIGLFNRIFMKKNKLADGMISQVLKTS